MNALTKQEGAVALAEADRLRMAVFYDPMPGIFRRAVPSSWAKAGDAAGCLNTHGYLEFNVLGRLHKAHRLAWLYMHGAWPSGDIDHIDGDRRNNAISNLRVVSNRTNSENRRKANRNSGSGLLGVRLHKSTGKFEARIRVDGRLRYLGLYSTPELAHAAYVVAKRAEHRGSTI